MEIVSALAAESAIAAAVKLGFTIGWTPPVPSAYTGRMAYTVRIIGFRPGDDDSLPARPLGEPPTVFVEAEAAYQAGNAEIMRMAAAGYPATFLVLDKDGEPVDHEGRRPRSVRGLKRR